MAVWYDADGKRRYKGGPGYTAYLRENRGRFLVRVRVPRDLQARFGKSQETYLRTSDLREAKRRAPIAVADIMARFERARLGKLTPAEIQDIAHAELQKAHDFLKADPFEGPGALGDWLFTVQDSDRQSLDYETLRPKAEQIINQIGAEVTEEAVKQVADALVNAGFTAQELWRRNIQPPAHAVSRRIDPPANGDGMTISALLDAWLFERKPPEKTESEWRRAVRRWQELHGDTPIRAITREQVSEYKDALLRCPARPPHKLRELPLPRLIEAAKAQGEYQATGAKAVNKTVGAIRSILSWAVDNGRLETNPAAKVKAIAPRRKSDQDRRPFTVPELQTVLTAAAGERRKGDRWLPFVAAFTGARQSELATARVADIKTQEGVTFIRITDEGEGRSIKNRGSIRNVPLHPALIDLGFLDYVKKLPKDGLLFPDSTNAAAYSKRFGRLLDKVELTDPTLVFHSFRHSFKDACRDSGLYEETHDALTGHAAPTGKNGNVGRDYGKGFSLHALNEAVKKIEYRGLDLSTAKL